MNDKELPVGRHPPQLYSLGTPNGVKVTVRLDSGAEYAAVVWELGPALRLDRFWRAVAGYRRPGMMLDRGQVQDWFTSTEVIVEAVIGGEDITCLSPHDHRAEPSFRSYCSRTELCAGLVLMFAIGTILVSSSALMAPSLQNLANYPVESAGLSWPRVASGL